MQCCLSLGGDTFCASETRRQELAGSVQRRSRFVEDKRNFARGRVRVARDAFDTEEVRQREAEQTASAEAALSRYEVAATPEPQP